MIAKVRKLTNISGADIPVQLDQNTTIYLGSGKTLENKDVHNLNSIREFVKVEQDMTEVNPITEGKTLLFD